MKMSKTDILKWKHSANIIWAGALIVSFTAILMAAIGAWLAVAPSEQGYAAFGLGFVIGLLGSIVLIVGLGGLRSRVGAKDAKSILLLIIGFGISCITSLFKLIPNLTIIYILGDIAAAVFMLIGFYQLKNSLSFPYKATKGAAVLFASFIVTLSGSFISGFIASWMPQASSVIAGLTVIAAIAMQLTGWYYFKTADPEDYLEKYPVKESEHSPES